MHTLAIANQKGGVGKSTLVVHLAYAAVEAGKRVLLVDLDRQRSLSLSFPAIEGAEPGTIASQLFTDPDRVPVPEILGERLAIIRADSTLGAVSGGDLAIARRPGAALARLAAQWDVCLIDTPGAIGFNPPMTVAALLAADAVVCPLSVGLYETTGLADLWGYLRDVRRSDLNPGLRLLGALPSKVNTKSPHEAQALEGLRSRLGTAILPHTLTDRAAVKQAIASRRPVWRGTRGQGHLAAAREWRAACADVLARLQGVQ